MSVRLIGLHGRKGSGKDSVYDAIEGLALERGLSSSRAAFADAMKLSGISLFNLPEELRTVEFADKLKDQGMITLTWGEGPNEKVTISGRQLWQFYGTEGHRREDLGHSFSDNFWVDNLLPEDKPLLNDFGDRIDVPLWHESFKVDTPNVDGWYAPADIGVITDVRFENEAVRIRELGGEVWYINAEDRLGPNEDMHTSEEKLPDELIDYVIENNGTKEELTQNVAASLLK